MKFVISCSSILLDLEEKNLLEQMFDISYTFLITDLIYQKDFKDDFEDIMDEIKVISLRDDTILYINQLVKNYPLQSHKNLCSLGLAKQENCPLFTNEISFQKICEEENINFYDTSYLIRMII